MIFLFALSTLPFRGLAQTTNTKTGFSVQVKNLMDKTPNVEDVRNGNIELQYFLNNKPVEAKFISCVVVHIPADGNIPAPYVYSDKSSKLTVPHYLKSLEVNSGDHIFLEDIKINYRGKKITFSSETKLSL